MASVMQAVVMLTGVLVCTGGAMPGEFLTSTKCKPIIKPAGFPVMVLRGGNSKGVETEEPLQQGGLSLDEDQLSDQIVQSLLRDADKNLENEMIIVPENRPFNSLTVAQRVLWENHFQQARNAGLGVRESQALALRNTAEGKPPVSMPDGTQIDWESRSVTCMACHVEMATRSDAKAHYSTLWHKVNSKRKGAGQAPLSYDSYEKRKRNLIAENKRQQLDSMKEKERTNIARAERKCVKLVAEMEKLRGQLSYDNSSAMQTRIQHVQDKLDEAKDMLKQSTDLLESLAESSFEPHTVQGSPDTLPKGPLERAGDGAKSQSNKALPAQSASVETTRNRYISVPAVECRIEQLKDFGPISACRCPFDGNTASDLMENLAHMADRHDFVLPYLHSLQDPASLLEYLVRKVYLGCACLYCGVSFPSPYAVQSHMTDRGHCLLPSGSTWDEELAPFYAEAELDSPAAAQVKQSSDDHELKTLAASKDGAAEETDWRVQRDRLGLGSWATQRHVKKLLRKAQLRASDNAAKDPQTQQTDLIRKITQKYQKLGMSRPGWRDISAAREIVRNSRSPQLASTTKATVSTTDIVPAEEYYGALWYSKQPQKTAVSKANDWIMRKKELRIGYQNYFTRKAALPKTNVVILNSGYRA